MHQPQDAFYRANLVCDPVPFLLPLERVVEMLSKSEKMLDEITFGYAAVDKPGHGFMLQYLVVATNSEDCPSDGYFWLDHEAVRTNQIDASRMLVIYERFQGVAPGDSRISMTRRRYHLITNGAPSRIHLIHYLAADDQLRALQINPQRFVTPARKVPLSTYAQMQAAAAARAMMPQQATMFQQQQPHLAGPMHMQHFPPALNANPNMQRLSASGLRNVNGTPTNIRKPSGQQMMPLNARSRKPGGQHPIEMLHANLGPNGVLQQLGVQQPAPQALITEAQYLADDAAIKVPTARELQLARLRRNHDWLERIFSPQNPKSMSSQAAIDEAATRDARRKKILELRDQNRQLKSELATLAADFDMENNAKQSDSISLAEIIQQVDAITSLDEFEQHLKEAATPRLNKILGHPIKTTSGISAPMPMQVP